MSLKHWQHMVHCGRRRLSRRRPPLVCRPRDPLAGVHDRQWRRASQSPVPGTAAPTATAALLDPAYIPRTDGKTERFIRTCLAGWAYHAAYRSWRARAAALPDWLQNHKFDRCHTGIGFITSSQRLAQRK